MKKMIPCPQGFSHEGGLKVGTVSLLPKPFQQMSVFFLGVILGLLSLHSNAAMIETDDIVAIPSHATGSGNGTLDLRLFTFSGSEIPNTAGTFNGDNGNNKLPNTNSGGDVWTFGESYVTTAGELKTYYNLNFPAGSVHEIVLFLDLNETTGDSQLTNTLTRLDVIVNPMSIQGAPDPFGDVSSAQQVAIKQVYTGGAAIAYLNPEPAANIPVNTQGAGFADYAIFTGIDPFGLNDSDVLLLNVSMANLSNGAEDIFLSGTYAPTDIRIPEPASMTLLALGGLAFLRKNK